MYKIPIEYSYILIIFKYFIDKKILTPNDLKHYIANPKSPKFEFIHTLSKAQIRNIWLYQIRNSKLYCEICGKPIDICRKKSPQMLTADHRMPSSKGGETNVYNLGPAHSKCNSLKANYTPLQWSLIGYDILKQHDILVDLKRCKYKYELEKER